MLRLSWAEITCGEQECVGGEEGALYAEKQDKKIISETKYHDCITTCILLPNSVYSHMCDVVVVRVLSSWFCSN